jgi:HPt (histidine-containing phosphotransfer) domain-containing protein
MTNANDGTGPKEASGKEPEPLPAEALDAQAFGRLAELEALSPGFLAELLVEFERGVEQRIQALREALASGNTEAIATNAHGMRGSTSTLGAMRMTILANRLEYDQPTLSEAHDLVSRIEAEYAVAKRALAAAVAKAAQKDPSST